MKKISFLLLPGIILAMISCKSNTGPGEGWASLFNGKNLHGWIIDCELQDQGKDFFYAEDGHIVVNSLGDKDHGYMWLSTEKEYGDFDLKLKFAAFEESPGNSGVQIRSRYDVDTFYLDGPQLDINPGGPWRTGMIYDETRGYRRWIFPDLPKGEWVNEEMVTQEFEFFMSTDEEIVWNEFEISAHGWKIESWLNGVKMTDFNNGDILNDSIHKRYNVGETGVISLQLHVRDELKMYFKDLYIKE